ncbi:hypothetical protein [Desulfoluna spongiiphila]|uniref:Uncharacterized protein n=1 Tax=Desulfoluna spongiiphila TaxID=419481 RepID=A0A1G5HW78_9BACT|nr:hypothetical protein [Desulfoluna spongiiphila]SCY68092.1 hypothetical protein SAMN05216233_11633 [Desulfoluna spongiiphila]VVS95010.1 hypothetical protein DBB_45870 [Desulfoluna spongiiphila]
MFPGSTILNYLFWMVMGAMQVIIILSANTWLKESGRQVPWWQTLLMYGCFLSFCAVVAGGFTLAGEYERRAGFYFIGFLGLPHIIAGTVMLKLFVFKKKA